MEHPDHKEDYVGVVLRPGTDLMDDRLMPLVGTLAVRANTKLFFEASSDHPIYGVLKERAEFMPSDIMVSRCDAIVSVGGDGTMLGVMRQAAIKASDALLIGVNMGTLGFITDIELADAPALVRDVLDGQHMYERRSTVECYAGKRHVAANDILVQRGTGRLLSLNVEINGRYAFDIRADGMLVSSPTGSTAYSLAAGGPIIEPTLEALLLTPLMPQNLSSRPIVLPPDAQVVIKAEGESKLIVDGNDVPCAQSVYTFKCGPNVKYGYHVKTYGEDRDFTKALRSKLGWNSR